jgi:hypothetical protein
VIKKNDGTGVYETIPLNPSTQAADYLLSVPLAQIASVGLIISNTDISTNNVTWDLTVSKKLPAATLQISPTDVAITLEPDVMDADAVQLTNVGLAGSVLDYTTYVMGQAPALKAARAGPHRHRRRPRRLRTGPGRARERHALRGRLPLRQQRHGRHPGPLHQLVGRSGDLRHPHRAGRLRLQLRPGLQRPGHPHDAVPGDHLDAPGAGAPGVCGR